MGTGLRVNKAARMPVISRREVAHHKRTLRTLTKERTSCYLGSQLFPQFRDSSKEHTSKARNIRRSVVLGPFRNAVT